MSKFIIFGFLPITFNAEGLWEADTGSVLLNRIAGAFARLALTAVAAAEDMLGVALPISLVPQDESGPAGPVLA